MASQSRGKRFEQQIREDFEKVTDVSVDRLPDQVTRYRGSSSNPCDFIVYKEPYEYYIECKTTKGASLPFDNIKGYKEFSNGEENVKKQWTLLYDKSLIQGVFAGILCWFYDKDVTKFIPIQLLYELHEQGSKSVRYDIVGDGVITFKGQKKRTYYSYDMEDFFRQIERGNYGNSI